MAQKTFINLSVAECREQYPKLMAESARHWETAMQIGEGGGNYGLAISTMIISMEEMTKAMVLFADANGFEFRKVNGMETIFKSHQIRYLILFMVFVLGIFRNLLKQFLLQIIKDPAMMKLFAASLKAEDKEAHHVLTRFAYSKFILIRKEYRWFRKMDVRRQSGFYSDFNDKLERPSDLTRDDFEHCYERLELAKSICTGFIDSITNNPEVSVMETLSDIQDSTKAENRYAQLENWLMTLKKHRYDAFAAFQAVRNY